MKVFCRKGCLFLTLAIFATTLSACTGLSKQAKATSDGISIEYNGGAKNSELAMRHILLKITDDRSNKDIVGRGFGAPYINDQESIDDVFSNAVIQLLSNRGAQVSKVTNTEKESGNSDFQLSIKIKTFSLDFNFGKWIGVVRYDYAVTKDGKIICEQSIKEKSIVFNLYGYGSAEEAINEVFNKAINGLKFCA